MNDKPKSKRGTASMSPERRREIASAGGRAVQASGKAHRYTSEEARAAGLKAQATGRCHRFTSEEASAAGRKGVEARKRNRELRIIAALSDPQLSELKGGANV